METNKIEKLLNEEMEKQLEQLAATSAGSETSKNIIDDFVQLHKVALERDKLRIEAEKVESDKELEQNKLTSENVYRDERNKTEKRIQIIQSVIQGVGVAATVVVTLMNNRWTSGWLRDVLKFEETGTIGSSVGRSLIGSIGRKK